MRKAPIAPWPAKPLQRMLVAAAVDLVPADLRDRLGLKENGLRPGQGALVSAVAKVSDRIPLRDAPPAQASIRLGRGATFLYR